MYQETHNYPHQSNLDSHLHQMDVYRNRRHIIPDISNRQNIRDHPDIYDVQMVKSNMLGSDYTSEQEIITSSNADLVHRGEMKRQSMLFDQLKNNSQLLVDSHVKAKRSYEQYIEELERKNQNLRNFENEIFALNDQIRRLEEEQTRYMTELNILAGRSKVDPQMLDTLRVRIQKLQREKLDLLDLVNMNKIKIEELHKKIHSQQVDYFPDRPQLLKEIEELERQLNKRSVVTEERVVYKEIPVRVQQEIIEEIVEVPIEEDESRYNPDCVCRCRCDCHKTHCHGYSQRHHNKVHNSQWSSKSHHHGRYSQQASTTNTYSQNINDYRNSLYQNQTPSFTKRDRDVQSYRVESSRQAYNMDDLQEGLKRGRSYSQTHRHSNEMKRLPAQMSSRSRSRKRYLFDMPQERRKRFDEEKMLWDRKLNFRKYEEIYHERDQLNLILQLMEQVEVKFAEYEQLIEEQKNKIQRLEQERDMFQAEGNNLRDVVDKLESNIEEIQDQNVKAQEDLHQQIKRKEEEKEEEKTELVDKYQKKIKYLEYQVYEFEQSKHENEKLKNELQQIKQQHEDSIQELKDSQINPDHYKDTQNNLKAVTEEKENLYREIESMNKVIEEKKLEIETMKKKHEEEVQKQKEEYLKLQQKQSIQESKMEERIQDLQNEIDNLRQENYQNTVEDKQSNHLEELENFDINDHANDLIQTPEKPIERNFDIEEFDNQPKISIPLICEKCKDIEEQNQQNRELYQKMEQNYHQARDQLEQANETILTQSREIMQLGEMCKNLKDKANESQKSSVMQEDKRGSIFSSSKKKFSSFKEPTQLHNELIDKVCKLENENKRLTQRTRRMQQEIDDIEEKYQNQIQMVFHTIKSYVINNQQTNNNFKKF